MKAYLVRVGIDNTKPKNNHEDTGQFNAPVDLKTMEFAYVPIKESNEMLPEFRRDFKDFVQPCDKLGVELPSRLWNMNAHVDPDFSKLTYGDIDGKDPITGKFNKRGRPLRELRENDILVFYAGLKPIQPKPGFKGIVDALIGLYVVQESVLADEYAKRGLRDNNAHTRRQFNETDIIVTAKPEYEQSGRLDKCIPVGNYRDNAHRVYKELLHEWGNLDVNDGWIQRSPRLTQFKDPERFYNWFNRQKAERQIRLIQRNN